MYKEDSLQFAQERLRQHQPLSPLARDLGFRKKPQIKRRLVAEMAKGDARTFERVDDSVLICCSSGSLWITHDGDPKDVFLSSGESYRADNARPMNVFAMQDCVMEIEFEDVALEH